MAEKKLKSIEIQYFIKPKFLLNWLKKLVFRMLCPLAQLKIKFDLRLI